LVLASSDRLWWNAARELLDLTMTDKRRALSALTKPDLLELARAFGLPATPRTLVAGASREDGIAVVAVDVK
jgi:hypothetical protein